MLMIAMTIVLLQMLMIPMTDADNSNDCGADVDNSNDCGDSDADDSNDCGADADNFNDCGADYSRDCGADADDSNDCGADADDCGHHSVVQIPVCENTTSTSSANYHL